VYLFQKVENSRRREYTWHTWRKVKVTERRAAEDFAACMRELTDVHYPEAERIRVVLDNLSTHSAGALYQTFPADEARRVLRRLEFHDVPKHASWLNMLESEIRVLVSQCLDRQFTAPPPKTVRRSIANLDSTKLPAISIPVALPNQAAGRLFDVDRLRRIINPPPSNAPPISPPTTPAAI
jgi:hypothetical protein